MKKSSHTLGLFLTIFFIVGTLFLNPPRAQAFDFSFPKFFNFFDWTNNHNYNLSKDQKDGQDKENGDKNNNHRNENNNKDNKGHEGDNKDKEIKNGAKISAKKVVCPTEDLLPNWGAGGPDITSQTADIFLA